MDFRDQSSEESYSDDDGSEGRRSSDEAQSDDGMDEEIEAIRRKYCYGPVFPDPEPGDFGYDELNSDHPDDRKVFCQYYRGTPVMSILEKLAGARSKHFRGIPLEDFYETAATVEAAMVRCHLKNGSDKKGDFEAWVYLSLLAEYSESEYTEIFQHLCRKKGRSEIVPWGHLNQ